MFGCCDVLLFGAYCFVLFMLLVVHNCGFVCFAWLCFLLVLVWIVGVCLLWFVDYWFCLCLLIDVVIASYVALVVCVVVCCSYVVVCVLLVMMLLLICLFLAVCICYFTYFNCFVCLLVFYWFACCLFGGLPCCVRLLVSLVVVF